jgi:sirohydrochlorin ferrochelatase
MPFPPVRDEFAGDLPEAALLLIAHGSREENANEDLHYLVEQLRSQSEYKIVEPSFLELAEPNIEQGAKACLTQGARQVILLPYFLSAGVHVRRDLTETCRKLAGQYPKAEFRLAEPLGRHPLLLQVLLERAQAAESG